jgi:hypothetical protein
MGKASKMKVERCIWQSLLLDERMMVRKVVEFQ